MTALRPAAPAESSPRAGRQGVRVLMRPALIGAVAVVWSLAFAAIHMAWALGSDVGLGGRSVTGVLLVIDVVAIPLCLLAAWVAWRLSDDRRAASAPRTILRMADTAAVILTLRGLGTIQAFVAPADDATLLTRLVDPYFLLGGILFALIARRARRARREAPSSRRESSQRTAGAGPEPRTGGLRGRACGRP